MLSASRSLEYASVQCSRPRLRMNLLPGVLRSSAAGTCIALHQRSRSVPKWKSDSYLLTGHFHCECPAGFDGTLQASESGAL